MDKTVEQIFDDARPYFVALVEELAETWVPNGRGEDVKNRIVGVLWRGSLAQARIAKARLGL